MADLRNFSQEFLLEFIQLYKSKPCLWKIKSKEYSNRDERNQAYEVLVKKLKNTVSDATKDTVVKKIDSLRKNFRNEYKKVEKSKKSGQGTDNVYKPKLWYYNELMFLKDQEIPRKSSNTLDENIAEQIYLEEEELFEDDNLSLNEPVGNVDNNSSSTETFSTPEPGEVSFLGASTSGTSSRRAPKRAPQQSLHEAVLLQVQKRLNTEKVDDEFDIIGKNIAMKLKKLPKTTKIVAEKFIMDILYQAELGNLSTSSSMIIENIP